MNKKKLYVKELSNLYEYFKQIGKPASYKENKKISGYICTRNIKQDERRIYTQDFIDLIFIREEMLKNYRGVEFIFNN